jgi:hypothetical protein
MALRAAALLLAAAAAAPTLADTHVWLVGGGNKLDNSQGQIEANVRWLEELLLADGQQVSTYFGLGSQPGSDVVYRPAGAAPSAADRVALVFGDYTAVGARYRRHELQALRGSTAKQELTTSLRRDFARLQPTDEVLLVYNGHGGIDHADTRDNYLKLWGDERLTVSELEAVLDAAPPATPIRFVMTQCYSGAFHALIYDDPARSAGFRGNRCGFMAESALRQAEGCELDVDQAEFRDYTTFFFAALRGKTRLGEPLARAAVDRDRDGAVSYREAHFHAIVAATSTDLPRSTSEQFLEDWAPWYLRWDSRADNAGSVYWSLAGDLAARFRWSDGDLNGVHAAQAAAAASSERRYAAERRSIDELRQGLAADLAGRWPELAGGEGAAFAARRAEVAAAIAADPRYLELERRQRDLGPLGRESLEATRLLTQVEKIYRLRHLARLEAALATHGSRTDRHRYGELLECEAGTLGQNAP